MKKQERARRLSTSEEVITQSRPKSARAARKVLREENTEVDPQTLAFRKTLAAKLRSEVIGQYVWFLLKLKCYILTFSDYHADSVVVESFWNRQCREMQVDANPSLTPLLNIITNLLKEQ